MGSAIDCIKLAVLLLAFPARILLASSDSGVSPFVCQMVFPSCVQDGAGILAADESTDKIPAKLAVQSIAPRAGWRSEAGTTTMRPAEIESRVLNIIENVKSGQTVEDSRVELKAEWPDDAYRAARRLAGHANAARGEPILWIIGVDEDRGVIGADANEMANWWGSVQAQFAERFAPDLIRHLSVPVDGSTVHAILWDTERGPYLVRNPAGGRIETEVPWRDGTRIRTAMRADLLRLLVPKQRLPDIDILGGQLQFGFVLSDPQEQKETGRTFFSCWVTVYLAPHGTGPIHLPAHRTRGWLTTASGEMIEFLPPQIRSYDPEAAVSGPTATVREPGELQVIASTESRIDLRPYGDVTVHFRLGATAAAGFDELPIDVPLREGGPVSGRQTQKNRECWDARSCWRL